MEKVFFKNKEGLKLAGILDEPDKTSKKIIIIVHGYSSSSLGGTATNLHKALIKKNLNHFRIDLDGCGASEGEFENQTISSSISDLEAAIVYLTKLGYEKIALFGGSMGGATVLNYTSSHPEKIIALACKAPVSNFSEQKLIINGRKFIAEWKEKGFYKRTNRAGISHVIPYSFFEDSKKHIVWDKVNKIICPTLIIHGTNDNQVPYQNTLDLMKNFPAAKLITIEGADHQMLVDGEYQGDY